MTEATAIGREPGVEVPAELCVALVYRVALLLQHAQGARYWWGQMEASKAVHTGSDYWLARSALLLSEQHLDEARDAWNKADELVQKLPAAGDYEFDRYRCLFCGRRWIHLSRLRAKWRATACPLAPRAPLLGQS